jgi:hypothetical protein
MTSKALKFVAPWKKAKKSNAYFYPVGQDQKSDHEIFFAKGSLRSQLFKRNLFCFLNVHAAD